MLLSAAVILALFALTWVLLSRSFLQITTAADTSDKAVYRERAVKRQSADAALFRKELARFTASPNYMLNCGLGVLLLPVSGILLLWKGGMAVSLLNAVFASYGGCAEVLLCTGVCAIGQTLAGAAREAQGAACAHGPSGARAACLHGVHPA